MMVSEAAMKSDEKRAGRARPMAAKRAMVLAATTNIGGVAHQWRREAKRQTAMVSNAATNSGDQRWGLHMQRRRKRRQTVMA
ncbi:hypothetical protein Scep_003820 [Stephania cephalantha]|uniref:Uncharacterized protein n=1 Tax=Stephania cephalantha TaxID=152367 RepID=A0AAP0KRC0_9MAGN